MLAPEIAFDPYDTAVMRDPYRHYARLRETGPVVRTVIDSRPVWILSHDRHIRDALTDWRTHSSRGGLSLHPRDRLEAGVLIATDPRRPDDPPTQPDHTDLLRVVAPYLAPRAMDRLGPSVHSWVYRLVGELVARGRYDVVGDLARVVATRVVGDLVGLPASDRHLAADWAAAATSRQGPQGALSQQTALRLRAMRAYVGRLGHEDELTVSGVGAAVFAAANGPGPVSREDAASIVWGGLIIAGLHTSIAAMTWAVLAAAQHPRRWDLYRALFHAQDPARLTWADEVLRHETIFPHTFRTAVLDTDVDGFAIPAEARVLLLNGSANRDPERWPEPDEFVLNRPDADQHLGLGWGPHRCLGQHLARLEVHAVLDAFAAHGVARFSTTGAQQGWAPNAAVRGWSSLTVAVETHKRVRELGVAVPR
jgi:cytochrome P450